MKTIKNIITIVFIIFCNSFCYTQQIQFTAAQELELHKKSIESAAYIFEGTVIQQSKQGEILTCNVISITKIFKGSPKIKLGTIKVITEQGPNIEDGEEGLSNGSTYIIFGIHSDSIMFKSIVTDNPISLNMDVPVVFLGKVYFDLHTRKYLRPDQIDSLNKNDKMIFYDRPAAQWGDTKYNTLDDLYAFFKENDLTVQEEMAQPQQSTLPADTTKQKKLK